MKRTLTSMGMYIYMQDYKNSFTFEDTNVFARCERTLGPLLAATHREKVPRPTGLCAETVAAGGVGAWAPATRSSGYVGSLANEIAPAEYTS